MIILFTNANLVKNRRYNVFFNSDSAPGICEVNVNSINGLEIYSKYFCYL